MSNLSESLAVLSENIKSFAREFTAKKLIFTIFLLIALILLTTLVTNNLTGFLYFKRINQKISAIERIELKSNNVKYINKLDSIYFTILSELENYNTKKSWRLDTHSPIYEMIIRIIISLIIPLLIIFYSLKDPDFRNIFIGSLIFAIIFIVASAFMPTIHKLWLTALIIVVGEIILLYILILFQKK